MNATQIVATIPIGRLQRPSVHGPSWNLSLRAIRRRNTGVM